MNKELAANSNISHYRIERKIGAGGLGEVYRLKIRERFYRQIKQL